MQHKFPIKNYNTMNDGENHKICLNDLLIFKATHIIHILIVYITTHI